MAKMLPDESFASIVQWVKENILVGEIMGKPLLPFQKDFARKIGIQKVDSIRVLVVNAIRPLPDELQEIAEVYLNTDRSAGITFGHVIFVKSHSLTSELIRHELSHVLQVERCGGLEEFLKEYISQVLMHGHENAPMEIEARSNE